jgi:DNA-binding transcriptional MocR family regulator
VAERGLAVVSGDDSVLDGDSGAVLAYSGVTPEEIGEGVTRLAAAIAAAQRLGAALLTSSHGSASG